MRRYPGYIFDLDGTLYRGSDPIEYAVEVVNQLAAEGARIRYLTNNSGYTAEKISEKLTAMGFPVPVDSIYSSGLGAAEYLRTHKAKSVFVVGQPGLHEILSSYGIRTTQESPADFVLVGICRSFTYDLLDRALQCLLGGAKLIATNKDTTFPLEEGRLAPGAGSIVAAVEAASGMKATVIGKPEPTLIQHLLAQMDLKPEAVLVVGDRLDTDIESATRAQCPAHLVLTGVTSVASTAGLSWSKDLRDLLQS